MNIVVVIQARLGSTRFPKKSVADLEGRPLITHVIDRARAIAQATHVMLAIPAAPGSSWPKVMADRRGNIPLTMEWPSAEVPEDDVLQRIHRLTEKLTPDAIVRVTGDCPLLAPDLADRVIEKFLAEHADFAWNDTATTGWPDGTDVEVFRWSLLDRAFHDSTTPFEREHVTPAMRRMSGVRMTKLLCSTNHIAHKWSVDTPEDLDVVRAILAERPKDFTFTETLKAAERAAKKVA